MDARWHELSAAVQREVWAQHNSCADLDLGNLRVLVPMDWPPGELPMTYTVCMLPVERTTAVTAPVLGIALDVCALKGA